MNEPQEGHTEYITWQQFLLEMQNPGSVPQGTPVVETTLAAKQEPIPGTELSRHRVRVSFDFDVVCNDGPIRNLAWDEGKPMLRALLHSFLIVDKSKVLDLMLDRIASRLVSHPETFLSAFFPQANTEAHELFKPAIDALEGDEGIYWTEGRDQPSTYYQDWMGLWTEELFECFSATFVSSNYEVIDAHE